jgi:FkbM family methyltransferase
MNSVVEKISWMPYKILMNLGKKKKINPINLDLNKININEKFIFYVDEKDEGLSSQLKAFGFREPMNSYYYYKFIKKSDIVLDIGANLGYFTILSKNAKKIICIEPIKKAIPILKKNIKINKLKKKCEIINVAVGRKKEKLLIETNDSLNFSKIVSEESKKTYKIQSYPLSFFCQEYKANMIKMDVEGYEYEILLNNIPKEVNKINLEFHTWLLNEKKIKELLKYFDKESFKISLMVECLPLRIYPFYKILKKTGLLKKVTKVEKNLKPSIAFKEIFGGKRKMKHLFLER